MAAHYVLHFDSVVEPHPIDDLREPFERALKHKMFCSV
jgi:hypothetical protein